MHKEIFEHLYNYMETHGGLPRYIKEEVAEEFGYENKLNVLIGRLCIPENGGLEMVMEILRLEFDPIDYENIVYHSFDIYFG